MIEGGINTPHADTPEERLKAQMRSVIEKLLSTPQQPGPSELLAHLETALGWPVRLHYLEVIRGFRDYHLLNAYQREYFRTTLTDESCTEALLDGAKLWDDSRSTIDELFQSSRKYRLSKDFQEMITFSAGFRYYAPYNNLLVKIQNPACQFYATLKDWDKRFHRKVKEDARPMLILAPMHPVMLVYDLDATEGEALPANLRDFNRVDGAWDDNFLTQTLENCIRDDIKVAFQQLSSTIGGFVTTRCREGNFKMRVTVHNELSPSSCFAVLCHELAHIYLGHLGSDQDGWWPARINLTHAAIEIEAEATPYIVCRRLNMMAYSEAYISSYLNTETIPAGVSLELIAKVAGKLEDMATRKLPPHREKSEKKPRNPPLPNIE